LLTPLLNPVSPQEHLYNEAHIWTRNVIERTFGVWKRCFPILAYGCRLKQETLLNLIIACAVLHNIAKQMGEEEPPLPQEVNGHELQVLIDNGQIPHFQNDRIERGIGAQIRRNFINNYFRHL
jgi:hypothetical protein